MTLLKPQFRREMKKTEYTQLTEKDLIEKIDSDKFELNKVKLNHAISPVENSSTIKKARREIARMITALREKQTVK